ncbi:MAG: pimeloyl-CoA dehydrogenase large subunit, partial [Betaproteobacteria bacterium]|nr:pimeloyl-CoA dehydrogenase large subunit [Betaproteobacteria bacterium]
MFDTPELAAFRAQVKQFVQQQLPTDLRATVRAGRQLSAAQYRAWHA